MTNNQRAAAEAIGKELTWFCEGEAGKMQETYLTVDLEGNIIMDTLGYTSLKSGISIDTTGSIFKCVNGRWILSDIEDAKKYIKLETKLKYFK